MQGGVFFRGVDRLDGAVPQLREICSSYPMYSGTKLYKRINQSVKHKMPKQFTAAQLIAQTEDHNICHRARNFHYYCFDCKAAAFTDDQALKLALIKKNGLHIHDPWLKRAPSKDELLVNLILRISPIAEVGINENVDATQHSQTNSKPQLFLGSQLLSSCHVSLYKVQAGKIRATYIFTRFILWYCKPVYANRNRLARFEPFILHITHYTKHPLKSLRM